MAAGSFFFDRFRLDPTERQLTLDDAPVELNARYLDALALLVVEQGKLVSKDHFLEEVWRGVPVTDEALTQCIRTLRRRLGDDAAAPRFIETVPKHGYRFIAPVTRAEPASRTAPAPSRQAWRKAVLLGAAGTLGGGLAGMLGGLVYGFAAQPSLGGASALAVLVFLSLIVGLAGGAGVGFGIAAAGLAPGRRWWWSPAGGGCGGLVVGALAKLLGLDAFNLLLGASPGEFTGAGEGALLGAAVGLGAWLADRTPLRRGVALAAMIGAVAGALIPTLGGRLMGGSLDLLARHFPASRLRLDRIGALFGEDGFGPLAQAATGALEGALFGACMVGVMMVARTRLGPMAAATAHHGVVALDT